MADEDLGDEYWKRYDDLVRRRRLAIAWFLLSPLALAGPQVFLPSLFDDIRIIGLPWMLLGFALLVRWSYAKCPRCLGTFFLRDWYSNPFAFRCLRCKHELP